MQYIFALIFAWIGFVSIPTSIAAVSINANQSVKVTSTITTKTITGQICFPTTLSSGSELVKIWASSDSGGKNIISNINTLSLTSGSSYPARCSFPNSKNESPLSNVQAIQNEEGFFALSLESGRLQKQCSTVFLNFDSNRQGKQNAFYQLNLSASDTCENTNISTTFTPAPTTTNSSQGTCQNPCRTTFPQCDNGLFCQTKSNGASKCYNNTTCPPQGEFDNIPKSCQPSVTPSPTLVPPSITLSPTPPPLTSSVPTITPSSSPTVTLFPTVSNTPTPQLPSCNETCATSLPACANGYFCHQTTSDPAGKCKNYTDCSPILSCQPSPTPSPTPNNAVTNCNTCLNQNANFLCEKSEIDTPPSIYCAKNDETTLNPKTVNSCYSCKSSTNTCPFFAQAQLLVQHTLANSNQVYLPLNINQKDIQWHALNDRQMAKNPLYSPKDSLAGSDNPFGFTIGKITANIENLTFPLPTSETNPLFRYNNFGDKASVKLFYPKDQFAIIGQFCQNLGSKASCPPEISNKQISSNSDTFSPLLLDCKTNLRYGWIVKKIASTSQNPQISIAPSISDAIAPNYAKPLLEQIEGFAVGTTGGLGANSKSIVVTDFSDDPKNPKPGTLRHALLDPSTKIVSFSSSGEITLKSDINLTSNTTLDGSGHAITIREKGFRLKNVKNIILNQLKMTECKSGKGNTGDAISIGGSEKIFLHRLDLSDYCDGLVDIYDGSTDITLSWSHLSNHVKAILISNDETTPQLDKNIRVTLHHNFFDNLDQRIPRVRYGKVDMYNNYIKNWGHYAIGSTLDSQILVERNIFEDFDAKKDSLISYKLNEDPNEEDKYFMGFVKMFENSLSPNDFTSKERLPQNVFLRPYQATIAHPNEKLKDIIINYAGK